MKYFLSYIFSIVLFISPLLSQPLAPIDWQSLNSYTYSELEWMAYYEQQQYVDENIHIGEDLLRELKNSKNASYKLAMTKFNLSKLYRLQGRVTQRMQYAKQAYEDFSIAYYKDSAYFSIISNYALCKYDFGYYADALCLAEEAIFYYNSNNCQLMYEYEIIDLKSNLCLFHITMGNYIEARNYSEDLYVNHASFLEQHKWYLARIDHRTSIVYNQLFGYSNNIQKDYYKKKAQYQFLSVIDTTMNCNQIRLFKACQSGLYYPDSIRIKTDKLIEKSHRFCHLYIDFSQKYVWSQKSINKNDVTLLKYIQNKNEIKDTLEYIRLLEYISCSLNSNGEPENYGWYFLPKAKEIKKEKFGFIEDSVKYGKNNIFYARKMLADSSITRKEKCESLEILTQWEDDILSGLKTNIERAYFFGDRNILSPDRISNNILTEYTYPITNYLLNKTCSKNAVFDSLRNNLKKNDVWILFFNSGKNSIIKTNSALIIKQNKDPELMNLCKLQVGTDDYTLSWCYNPTQENKNSYVEYSNRPIKILGTTVQLHFDAPTNNEYCNIWGVLSPYLTENEEIYYTILDHDFAYNIEFLKDSLGIRANERYKLHRVTDPMLINKTNHFASQNSQIALFGNLYYPSIQIPENESSEKVLTKRSFVGTLPGSKFEIEKINTAFSNKGKSVLVYEGSNGTEEAFRTLQNSQCSILHLATHGFDWRHFPFSLTERSNLQLSNLQKQGILLSFCGKEWNESNIRTNNDGIVSLDEICEMQFSNIDLCVLSACKTMSGSSYDNHQPIDLVWALKMAGVKTIIATIHDVDDLTTSEFMTTFYEHVLDGESYYSSFRATQNEMINKYPDDWRAWASFVLIDGW